MVQEIGNDPHDKGTSRVFDLHFFLTEAEWLAACRALHPIVANPSIKPVLRIVNGLLGIAILALPHHFGSSWRSLFRHQTAPALLLASLVFVNLWSATGIGMEFLNHRLNRLDLQRHVVVNDAGVVVDWNERSWNYRWKDFAFFEETADVVVLRTAGTKFWTIPIRALAPADLPRFRELVREKLPRRPRVVLVFRAKE